MDRRREETGPAADPTELEVPGMRFFAVKSEPAVGRRELWVLALVAALWIAVFLVERTPGYRPENPFSWRHEALVGLMRAWMILLGLAWFALVRVTILELRKPPGGPSPLSIVLLFALCVGVVAGAESEPWWDGLAVAVPALVVGLTAWIALARRPEPKQEVHNVGHGKFLTTEVFRKRYGAGLPIFLRGEGQHQTARPTDGQQ